MSRAARQRRAPRSPRPRAAAWVCALALVPAGCLKIPTEDAQTQRPAATAPTTADELLARYAEAIGGEAAVRAQAHRTVEARIEFEVPCDEADPDACPPAPSGTFLLVTTADGRMYRRILVRGVDENGRQSQNAIVTERGFDGETGWEVQAGPTTFLSIDASTERTRSREDALLPWFLAPGERGIRAELLPSRVVAGDEGTPERILDGVSWTDEAGTLVGRSYWFDRATGLLYEERDEEPGQGSGQGSEEAAAQAGAGNARFVRYDDYRRVDGVLVAHDITQVTRVVMEPGAAPVEDSLRIRVSAVHHRADGLPDFEPPTLPAPDPVPDAEVEAMLAARDAARGGDVAAAMAWARGAWRLGNFDEVDLATKAALRKDKREPEALWLRARAAIMRGDFKLARSLLKRAKAAGVSPAQIEQQLGLIEIRERRFRASAQRFERVGLAGLSARFSSFKDRGLTQSWATRDCVMSIDNAVTPAGLVFEALVDDTPVRLLFDSSVASLVLDQQTAIRMLVGTDASSALGNSGMSIGHGRVEELRIQDLTLKDVPVDLYPPQMMAQALGVGDIDGIAGPRVFEQLLLHVIPADGRVELVRGDRRCANEAAARRPGDGLPYAVQDVGNLLFYGGVNDTQGTFLFNSGLRGASLVATTATYARAGVGTPTLYGDRPGAPYVEVERFTLGGQQLPGSVAVWGFEEQPNPDGIRIDGMFGVEAFGARPWTLDFPRQRLYVAPTPATPTPTPDEAS